MEQAIHLARNAVLATPEDSTDRDVRLTNLGHGLLERYQQTGRMEALEQAINAFHRAILATPEDSATRAAFLSNLSGGLTSGIAAGDAKAAGSDAAIVTAGETVWSQLPDPVYLSAARCTDSA